MKFLNRLILNLVIPSISMNSLCEFQMWIVNKREQKQMGCEHFTHLIDMLRQVVNFVDFETAKLSKINVRLVL